MYRNDDEIVNKIDYNQNNYTKAQMIATGEIIGKTDIKAEKQVEYLPLQDILFSLVSKLNKLPFSIRKVDFRISEPNHAVFKLKAENLERKAYSDSGYGHRAEEGSIFDNQYRGSTDHGDIQYIGLYTNEGNLTSFFSIFQNNSFLFNESRIAIEKNPDLQGLPVFVISKLARDPDYKKFLYQAGAPHRLALILSILALAWSSKSGILIETQGQPDTIRMVREEVVTRFFPTYRKVIDVPIESDDANPPHKLLLYFPYIGYADIFNTGKELIKQRVRGNTSKVKES